MHIKNAKNCTILVTPAVKLYCKLEVERYLWESVKNMSGHILRRKKKEDIFPKESKPFLQLLLLIAFKYYFHDNLRKNSNYCIT